MYAEPIKLPEHQNLKNETKFAELILRDKLLILPSMHPMYDAIWYNTWYLSNAILESDKKEYSGLFKNIAYYVRLNLKNVE